MGISDLNQPFVRGGGRVFRLLTRVPRGPQDWKNSISRGNVERIKPSIRNEIFNREWSFHSGPLVWPQKNRAWDWNFQSRMKISNREWKFQARMRISCVGEWFFSCGRARMNFFNPRALWVRGGRVRKTWIQFTHLEHLSTSPSSHLDSPRLASTHLDSTRLDRPQQTLIDLVGHAPEF